MASLSKTAAVIGGNWTGCLVAQVLSHYYDQVVIVEKGDFDDETQARRSVPQEHHVHLLLLKGKAILEEIFPGLLQELEQHGAVVADLGHDVKWFQYGRWKSRYKTFISAHYCSRRLIDNLVKRRIRKNARISVVSSATATGLVTAGNTVNGIEYRAGGTSHRLSADLVIDASGRGSRTSQWISSLLNTELVEECLDTRLGYASRIYQSVPQYRHLWKVLLVLPWAPKQQAMGVISPIEGGRWLVTTGGWFGNFPDANPENFLDFLKTLPVPDIYDIIKSAVPMSEVFCFGMPGSRRRRYDLLPEWPAQLLVIGDALCSLNPLYSQGMTLAALEVCALRDAMAQLAAGELRAHEVQRRIGNVTNGAWTMAVEEDMRFPEAGHPRGRALKFRHWYGAGLGRLSATHRFALQTQVAVTNLVAPATVLYGWRLLLPVIAGRIGDALRVHGES